MFYDLKPAEREAYKISLKRRLRDDALVNRPDGWLEVFSHEDTYVRREAYLAVAKLYRDVVDLRSNIMRILDKLFKSPDPLVRQTVINSYGEGNL